MSEKLFLATRKGFFTLKKKTDRWSIDDVAFLGNNATMCFQDLRDRALYVAFDHGHFGVKLHRSDDDGKTWKELSPPAFPKVLEDAEEKPSVSEIWSLESAGPDKVGSLWAGTIPGGLFHSADRGDSWQLVTSLWNREERKEWFGGGKDFPGIHSICVDPRDSDKVMLGVSCGGVWVTENSGETWNCKAEGMRAEYMPPERTHDPNIQDPHILVQCPGHPDALWVQHHNGIFKSTDCANSWQEIENPAVSPFGFATAVHPTDPQTAWFVPGVKDECRVPVDGKLVVTRTTDGGKSFDVLGEGLPQEHCYDIVFRHCLAIDSTGSQLAMGSSTGSLWISENGGENWLNVAQHLPQIYCVRFAN